MNNRLCPELSRKTDFEWIDFVITLYAFLETEQKGRPFYADSKTSKVGCNNKQLI